MSSGTAGSADAPVDARGGRPEAKIPGIRIREDVTPAEAAAVLAAVHAVERRHSAPRSAPWLRASLREGVGHRPAAEPADLR